MTNTENFRKKFEFLMIAYKGSKHQFFKNLAECDSKIVQSDELLNELYKRYQSAMHATRVMVYHTPHLDSIDLRMAKLKVISDDDGNPSGDSHHYQLRRSWAHMLGHEPAMDDSDFGELSLLEKIVDSSTKEFIITVKKYYPISLGPWIMIEGLAHDWIGAWQHALSRHFPDIAITDYFIHNYANEIELSHAQESINLVTKVLSKRPDLVEETLEGAEKIGNSLVKLWDGMNEFVIDQKAK